MSKIKTKLPLPSQLFSIKKGDRGHLYGLSPYVEFRKANNEFYSAEKLQIKDSSGKVIYDLHMRYDFPRKSELIKFLSEKYKEISTLFESNTDYLEDNLFDIDESDYIDQRCIDLFNKGAFDNAIKQ